jgi:hypothetical protein
MLRRILIGIVVLTLALGALRWLPPPRLAEQYLAPQFTCACRHTMVLEFKEGRVRLHNMGHNSFYECGSFKTDGSQTVWNLPDYGTGFILQPERSALRLTEEKTGKTFLLQRPYWNRSTSLNTINEAPITGYISDFVGSLQKKRKSRF